MKTDARQAVKRSCLRDTRQKLFTECLREDYGYCTTLVGALSVQIALIHATIELNQQNSGHVSTECRSF